MSKLECEKCGKSEDLYDCEHCSLIFCREHMFNKDYCKDDKDKVPLEGNNALFA